MPSVPIPISGHNDKHNSPSASTAGIAKSPPWNNMSSNSPSSSISISPQTPFFPPPAISNHLASPKDNIPNQLNPSSPPNTQSGFFKWAAASLGKSPPTDAQRGFDIPKITSSTHGNSNAHDDDHHEHHDSFEFGDFDDLKSRSWNTQRRAVSMSGPSPSGITAMLSGFKPTSPPNPSGIGREFGNGPGAGAGGMPMSVPTNGVLAENAAKGQGVLRRLSMTGSGSFRAGFLSPNSAINNPLSPPLNNANHQPTFPDQSATLEPPRADAGVQRAATISGGTARGRRYSDSGKKRGVSPMGERILRDHGHF